MKKSRKTPVSNENLDNAEKNPPTSYCLKEVSRIIQLLASISRTFLGLRLRQISSQFMYCNFAASCTNTTNVIVRCKPS